MRDRTLWTWHLIAGLVILVFLGLHMTIMHLNSTFPTFNNPAGGEAESWLNVVWRMKSMFFAVTYVVLLGAALYHGLYGLRNILFELNPGSGLRTTINAGFWVVGLGLFGFGAYVALVAPGVALAVGG
jgi:succinate dehydrogenase hydrophobic anchor subunit